MMGAVATNRSDPKHNNIIEPKLPDGALGWSFWRNGEHNGFARSKRSLLVGLDMIPLRGLNACEVFMNSRGWSCLPTTIRRARAGEAGSFYGPLVVGTPDTNMLEWSNCWRDAEDAAMTIAFFIETAAKGGGYLTRDWHPELVQLLRPFDIAQLSMFHWMWRDANDRTQPEDKRRRTTLAHNRAATLDTFQRLGIEIQLLKWEPVIMIAEQGL